MSRSSPLATLCALCTAVSIPAFADTTTPEIVVTATRTPLDAGRIAASTTVIDREEIEAKQARSLPDLLRDVAGLEMAETGGPGKSTTLFMRGTESDHVLVLINGVRVGSVSAGLTAFELIPVEHIERIEIVRGPRASQWGSEAIGGVVQIFTRSGKDLADGEHRYEAGAGAGSYNSYTAHASTSGATGDSHYQASVSHFDTEGFDAREPVTGPFGFSQPDNDGYKNTAFHLRGGHRFSDDFDIGAFLLRAEGDTQFDGTFQDRADFVQQVLGARANWQATDKLGLRFRVGESRDESTNYAPDDSFASRFDGKRREASVISDIELSEMHTLNVGVDYRNDMIDSDSEFTESSRDNTGVFVQYLGTLGRHNVTASLRHDDNEAFGGETTGGLGWSTFLPSGLKLYASYGTAFKTPSFNELYFPGFGNPDLDPETSESIEAGIEGRPAWGTWSVRAYRTAIDNLIATVFDPVTGTAFPQNVNKARINGLEMEARTFLAGYDISASLNLLDAEDRQTGNELPRRPDTALSLDVSRAFDRLRVGGHLTAQGDRFDDVDNTVKDDGFVTVDLTAEYELRPGLFLRGKVGNVFDEDYQTVATFNSAGRNFFLSVLYRNQP